jgi:P27 family predicted phage terminase small subunit
MERRRTPTRTLEKRGSWRAKTRTGEPQPVGMMPACPDWLNEDAHAEWLRVVPQLEDMGIIGATDFTVLVGYCESWSQYKMAAEMLERTGPLHKPRNDGEVRRNPVVFILKDAREAMLKFARELGLSPSSRASVSSTGRGSDIDPLAVLLRKRESLN